MISFSEILKEYPDLFSGVAQVRFWAKKANPNKVFDIYISPKGHKERRLTSEQFKKTIFLRQKYLKNSFLRKTSADAEIKKAFYLLQDETEWLTKEEIRERYGFSLGTLNRLFFLSDEEGFLRKRVSRGGKLIKYFMTKRR